MAVEPRETEFPTKPPLRVALVITGLAVGGAEKCLTQLAVHLDRGQFAAEVYSLLPRPQGEKAALVEQLEAHRVPLHFLDARSIASAPRVVAQLRRHFGRQQPHVVQSFLYHANVAAIVAARLSAIDSIFTGIRVADPDPFRRQIERWLYRFAALNVCVSRSVADDYTSSGFSLTSPGTMAAGQFWQRKLQAIANAIDVAPYADAQPADLSGCGFGPERRILLYVGRLDRQKGLDWLVACLPDLLTRLPDFELLLAGDGPERDALMRQAVQLGVAGHVHFLGWRSDVPQLLKRSDLLVLPSRYEGMPNVLLEALASGVPVVATRAEGAAEVLGELAEDCLVDFGRSCELVSRLIAVATDDGLHRKLIETGKQRVEREFSITTMVRSYQQLWQAAISASTACP